MSSVQLAVVKRIHHDRVDVQLDGGARWLRGLRVIGGTGNLHVGQTISVQYVDGQMVAQAFSPAAGVARTVAGGGGSGSGLAPHAMSLHTDEHEWHAGLAGDSLHAPKDHDHSGSGEGGLLTTYVRTDAASTIDLDVPLRFGDSGCYILSDDDGYLDLGADVGFRLNGSVVLSTDGSYLGVDYATPKSTLHIGGNGLTIGTYAYSPADDELLRVFRSGDVTLALDPGSGNDATIAFRGGSSVNQMSIQYDGANNKLYIAASDEASKWITIVRDTGCVGLGTTSPEYMVELSQDDDYAIALSSFYSDNNHYSHLYFRKARGTRASPGNVLTGDCLGSIDFCGRDGSYRKYVSIIGAVSNLDSDAGKAYFYLTNEWGNQQCLMTIEGHGGLRGLRLYDWVYLFFGTSGDYRVYYNHVDDKLILADEGGAHDLMVVTDSLITWGLPLQSDGFSAGASGWEIQTDGDAELESLIVRSTVQVDTFVVKKNQASNGTLWVTSASTLASAPGVSSENITSITVSDSGLFAANDYIVISTSSGDKAEYKVTDASSDPTLVVSFITGSGITFSAGDAVVSTGSWNGSTGTGFIVLDSIGTNRPFVDVRLRTADGEYGSNTEVKTRIGNLDGISGCSGYGLYSDNVFLEGEITAVSGAVGGWTINSTSIQNAAGDMVLHSDGYIAFGSTPPTAKDSGTGVYIDAEGIFALDSGSYQVKIDASDGKLYAGGGNVVLDSDGITVTAGSASYITSEAYKLTNAGGTLAGYVGLLQVGPTVHELQLTCSSLSGENSWITVGATAPSGYSSQIVLSVTETGGATVQFAVHSDGYCKIDSYDLRVGGGLGVGAVGVDPSPGSILLAEQSSIGTPASGYLALYADSDEDWPYAVNSNGTRLPLSKTRLCISPEMFALSGNASLTYTWNVSVVNLPNNDTDTSRCDFNFRLPPGWAGRDLGIRILWCAAGTSTGTVTFNVEARRLYQGAQTNSLTIVTDTLSATGPGVGGQVVLTTGSLSLSSWGEGNWVAFRIYRNSAGGNDTLTNAVYLLAVELRID